MRRLLSSTTALSVALASATPFPISAQVLNADGYVVASDGTVLCEPTADTPCDPKDYKKAAKAIDKKLAKAQAKADAEAQAEAEAEAEAVAQAQAEADAQAQAEADAQAQAEADAQAKAEADAQAQAEADAQAQADAQVQAEADAAAQAEVEAQAQADAQAEADAQVQAEADAAAQAEVEAQAQADAQAEADAQVQAEAEAAAQAEVEAQAQADAQAQAEADAQAKAEADAEAQAEADAQAQAEADAEAQAEADAQAQAEADAQAQTEADAQAQAEAAAQAQTEADAQAQAQAEADAQAQAEADAQAQAEVDAQAETDAQAEAEAQAQAEAEAQAQAEAEAQAQALADAQAQAEADAQAQAEAEAQAGSEVVQPEVILADPAAGLTTAPADEAVVVTEPVDVPVPTETEVQTLTGILGSPEAADGQTPPVAAAAAAAEAVSADGTVASEPSADAQVTSEVITADNIRTSEQEFSAAPVKVARGKKNGLSDLEKVGLIALGALVVGAVINEGRKDQRQVVSNTGDRVVVENPDGSYNVFKDDDTVLRQPGATVRTETYRDGSTRSIIERQDGSQIVTVRDASGRVLRRVQYDGQGRELVLIDDLEPEEYVEVRDLPKPRRTRATISTSDEDAALQTQMAGLQAARVGRTFSLRQIREISEVRALAATIDVDNITFNTGSAAIDPKEAQNLAEMGALIGQLLEENPGEVFLIEGHTDAVGSAASNLALSDRRAESVALALTEYFDVPPENLVVQGYGESELRIDTDGDERLNRRVSVRVITPLLRKSAT